MNEEDIRWNRFIDEVCYREITILSLVQKMAVLCFWYDAEMNSGGHSGYFDCYPDTIPEELYYAIIEVGNKKIADNYKKALNFGEDDGYKETDNTYYGYVPSLCDFLMEYVENNKEKIFE